METVPQENKPQSRLTQVTPLSKYLAMVIFIIVPFLGGYIGYTYAPEKITEVEKVVIKEVPLKVPTAEIASSPNIIDQGEYKIRYSSNKIEVLDLESKVLQTIPWDTSYRKVYSYEPAWLITNRDINYDHYLDAGILTSIGYGGVNLFYTFYTYNPKTKMLEGVKSLTNGETGISNPTFDIEKQTITSHMKSGSEWVETTSSFKDGTFSLSN